MHVLLHVWISATIYMSCSNPAAREKVHMTAVNEALYCMSLWRWEGEGGSFDNHRSRSGPPFCMISHHVCGARCRAGI